MKEDINKLREAVMHMATIYRTYGGGDISARIYEILNPPNPKEFLECDTCRSKPGSPILCKGCLHNRDLIASLTNDNEK